MGREAVGDGAHRVLAHAEVDVAAGVVAALDDLGAEPRQLLAEWPERLQGITAGQYAYEVRDLVIEGETIPVDQEAFKEFWA